MHVHTPTHTHTHLVRAAGPAGTVELSQYAPSVGRPLLPPPRAALFPAAVSGGVSPPPPSSCPRGGARGCCCCCCPSRFRIPYRAAAAAAAAAENAHGVGRRRRPGRHVVVAVVVHNTFTAADGVKRRGKGIETHERGCCRCYICVCTRHSFIGRGPGRRSRTPSSGRGLRFSGEAQAASTHPCIPQSIHDAETKSVRFSSAVLGVCMYVVKNGKLNVGFPPLLLWEEGALASVS